MYVVVLCNITILQSPETIYLLRHTPNRVLGIMEWEVSKWCLKPFMGNTL